MQAREAPAVLSVGRLYCDLIFTGLPRLPSLGTEIFSDGFGVHAGGGAFITAAHLAQLGHPSALAAMLPAAPFADLMRPDLVASGVDLSLCARLAQTDGPQITVAMAHVEDRAFLTRKIGPAFPRLLSQEIKTRGFKHIHVGEVASLVEQPDIIDCARSANMTISVDCGWDDAFDAEALKPLIRAIDVFLPNETEIDALKRLGIDETLAPITVVKRGRLGASFHSSEGVCDAPAIATEVLDATGAGDAFNAGFLASWLLGHSPRHCLEAGNRRGAFAVRNKGGFAAQSVEPAEVGIAGE